jgi:gamma-glutamyltranspeptidase/glutathione hydrolase
MVASADYPLSNRPVVMGVNGMVASANPLATLAGLGVLHEGGNAFDAAVAVGSTLGVVEPYMSGPGGIGVALMYVAREDRIRVLNFSGRAPAAAEPDRFADESKGVGILSSLVPGNVAGWLTLHEAYGSLERERLFRPAIGYAQEGFPVTYGNSHFMNLYSERLMLHPSAADIVLGPDGRAPSPGQRLRFPDLAGTLRTVARQGQETFYRGEIAERMVNANRQAGGLLGDDDLATYEAEWQEPVSITYRGYDVYTTPPNSSGFQILQTLKLMDGYPTGDIPYQAADTLHLFAEAVKLAVTDRIKYGGDPDHITAPIRGLLSDEYVSERRRLIDRERASVVSGEHYARIVPEGALMAGRPEEFDGGMTTHFAIADRDGNVVSITQTLGGFFGSAVPLGDTGVFLNNMCYWFDLDEGSPNRIGPGRRVDFVVAPTQSFLDGKFVLSMGTPGSWGILQTTPQMIMNVLDYGMNVQQAIEAPRLRCFEGRRVEMEERFPLSARRALERKGHEVAVIEAWSMSVGGAQGIVFDSEQGVFQGGADPRRDGYAAGL